MPPRSLGRDGRAATDAGRSSKVYTKQGNSQNVNLLMEIGIASALGLVAGGMWKVSHWNSRKEVSEYYAALEKEKAKNA